MDRLAIDPKFVAPTEKPKKTKPRRIVREMSFKLGNHEINLVIWKHKAEKKSKEVKP